MTSKIDSLKKFVWKRGQSLIHKDVFNSIPKNKGLWCHVFSVFPASYQTKAGKRMQNIIIKELKNNPKTKKINEKIGKKDIEILILYKLVNKTIKRDIDNYTKNIIDSLRKGGLFEDDVQIKFCASKIEYIKINDEKYSRALEKAIVRIDFFNDRNKVCKEFDKIFKDYVEVKS